METTRTRPNFIPLAGALTVIVALALAGKQLKGYEVHGPPNELVTSSSPFLRSSCYQRIHWLEWGDHALRMAQRRNKLLFIEVGTFWSRLPEVVTHQVLAEPTIVQYLNDNFVCIMVDADQRPDVATTLRVQAEGNTDFPLLLVATPEGTVVAAESSVPTRDHLYEFLRTQRIAWAGSSRTAASLADQVFAATRDLLDKSEHCPAPPSGDLTAAMAQAVYRRRDPGYGGFLSGNSQRKAPTAPILLFLLERAHGGDLEARDALQMTLDTLQASALHDWVHGGFHLLTYDREWRRPEFAKLLVINAQLLQIYALAADELHEPGYRDTAASIAGYIRDFLWDGEQSGFTDAVAGQTNPVEPGGAYGWTLGQVQALLSPSEAMAVRLRFGMDLPGALDWDPGLKVLAASMSIEDVAKKMGTTADSVGELLDSALDKMSRAKGHRGEALPRDTAIYADQSGLAAYCFAVAGNAMGNDVYRSMAVMATDKLMASVSSTSGLIPHGGGVSTPFLGDQVWPARAATAIYRVTGDSRYLRFAKKLTDLVIRLYEDREHSMGLWQRPDWRSSMSFSATGDPIRALEGGIIPVKPADDGLAISDNAAAALLGLDLYEETRDEKYLLFARRVVYAFGASVGEGQADRVGLAMAMDRYLSAESKGGR